MKMAQMRKGFTLIELLVVVVIIGILAGVGVKGFAAAQDRARNSSMMSNVRTVFLGVENWKTDNNGVPLELIDGEGGSGQQQTVAAGDGTAVGTWPKYLPGGRLPRTPWATKPQTKMEGSTRNASYGGDPNYMNTITMTGTAGQQAEFRLDDKGLISDGLEGSTGGTIPSAATGPTKRTDYGYMYYLGNSGSGRYAILGVGKYNGTPYVVAVKTNFN